MKLEDLSLGDLKNLHQALANGGRGPHREALREQGIGQWSQVGEITDARTPMVLGDDDELIEDENVIELSFAAPRKTG